MNAKKKKPPVKRRKRAANGPDLNPFGMEYKRLFNCIHDPCVVMSIDPGGNIGRIVEANDIAHTTLGYKRKELIGMHLHELEAPEPDPEYRRLKERFERDGVVIAERTIRARDGRRLPFEISSSVFFHEGRQYAITIARDITERKKARREMEYYRNMVERSSDAMFMKDGESRYLIVNGKACEVLGLRRDDILGRRDDQLGLDRAVARSNIRHDRAALHSKKLYEYNERIVGNDGVERWFHTIKVPVRDASGGPCALICIAHDITQERRMQQEMIDIETRNVRRIGHDLHDRLGQHLTGLAFTCKALQQRLESESHREAAQIASILAMVNEAIREVRRLSRGVSMIDMEQGGLRAALMELAESTRRTYRIACTCSCPSSTVPGGMEAATHLLRIAQEAVNNAVRHGMPKRITIGFSSGVRRTRLTVRDDGAWKEGQHEGMGLRIMEYRARMIGAVLEIKGTTRGTTVSCTFSHKSRRKRSDTYG